MHLFFHSAVVVAAVDTDVVVAELYASKQILAAWGSCQQLLHEDLHIGRNFSSFALHSVAKWPISSTAKAG